MHFTMSILFPEITMVKHKVEVTQISCIRDTVEQVPANYSNSVCEGCKNFMEIRSLTSHINSPPP